MIDSSEMARTVADTLVANPAQKSIEIETPGMSSRDILALIDAIFSEAAAVGVEVKGVRVDPTQLGLPTNAEFINAFLRDGRLIVVDIEVDDKVIVRRK